MNKRSKHITVNLTSDEYNAIVLIAEKTKRKIADVAYLMLNESIEKNIINFVNEKNAGFKNCVLDPFNF